jgi:predicted dehydrogenase
MKKIRVGVIGVGYLGKFHTEKYSRMDNVELVGVADIDRSRADDVAAEFGAQAFTDYRDLFGHVDAVSIVVPTAAHFSVGSDFLNRDVDVLLEKPMTSNLEQADELIEIAESRGRILQVGHLERFNPAIMALKDIVKYLMIHDIDIIMHVVKSRIKSIHAAGAPVICENADIANARLEFESGCVANVTASRISIKNQRKIRLFQKDAYISVDFANRNITIIRQDEKQSNDLIPGMDIQQLTYSEADALEDELAAYIQAVSTRQAPEVTGRAGRKALEIALNIMDQINAAIRRHIERS